MNRVCPRRSALYLPGSNVRAIEKAKSLPCDVVIFDLEDAVAPDAKIDAREHACLAVANRQFGMRELIIRINAPGTPWYADDLRRVSQAGPDAILLPKVDGPEQVVGAANELHAVDAQRHCKLWCMIETPKGVLAAERIAAAHESVDCLVMGTSDLTKDLHALHTAERFALLTSLGLSILAARAHGKTILDGVCLDIANEDLFRSACRQAKELGFDGKTLIHPSQILPCNAVFSPTVAELSQAHAVVEAFARSRAEGRGVAVLDGRLVEELHVREAERVLALAAAVGENAAAAAELA